MGLKEKIKNLIFIEESTPEIVQEKSEAIDIKKSIKSIQTLAQQNWFYYILLIPVMILSLYIRTRNLGLLKGKYLLGLDPYHYFRYSQYNLEHGHIMVQDLMRKYPIGTTPHFDFFTYFMAQTYKLVSAFGLTQIQWHIVYPPIITAISLIFFFLFVKNVFNNKKIALLATLILAILPAYLYRTLAGFADHEALFMLFMFIALWLFTEIRIRKKYTSKLIFAGFSGIFTAIATLTWVGAPLLTIPIAAFILVELFLDKIPAACTMREICSFSS